MGKFESMRAIPIFALLIAAYALSGCEYVRFKGAEGFSAATQPVDYEANRSLWTGDPYASGGIAKGSGGRITATTYGAGADPNAPGPVNARLDQPEKGVGLQAGEYHQDHATGYGTTNSPISQTNPGDAGSIAARAGGYAAPGGH